MAVVDFLRVPPQRISKLSRGRCGPTPAGPGGFGRNTNTALHHVDGQRRTEDRMSGTTMPVIGMTTYDFGGLGVPSKTAELIVAANLDVTAFTSATLLVAVHDIDLDQQAQIDVVAYAVLPSPQDPSKEFKRTTALGTVTLNSGNQEGTLVAAALTPPIGAFITITVKGTTVTNAPSALTATISIDLSLKSA